MIELPTYIWGLVFQYLSPTDAYNVTVASKGLYEQLRSNEIWSDIVNREWVNTLCDYDFEQGWELRNSDPQKVSSFHVFVAFRNRQHHLERFLTSYHPLKGHDEDGSFEQAVEKFATQNMDIAVIYSILVKLRRLQLSDFQNYRQYLHKIALLENLMVCQNRRLYYLSFITTHQLAPQKECSAADFETAMFNISLLDKSFHHLVKERSSYFLRCRKYFEQVWIDIYANAYSGVRWSHISTKGSSAHLSLDFKDNASYYSFVIELLDNVLNKLIPSHTVLNSQKAHHYSEYTAEDHSLLRFYGGLAFGSQDVIISVAAKMMAEFFKTPVRIYPNHTTPKTIQIDHLSRGLRVGFSHIFFFGSLGRGVRVSKGSISFCNATGMTARERVAISPGSKHSPTEYFRNYYESVKPTSSMLKNVTSITDYHTHMLRTRGAVQKICMAPSPDLINSELTRYNTILLPWLTGHKPSESTEAVQSVNEYLDRWGLYHVARSTSFGDKAGFSLPKPSSFKCALKISRASMVDPEDSIPRGTFVRHKKFGDFGIVLDRLGWRSTYNVFGENNDIWFAASDSLQEVVMNETGFKMLQIYFNTVDIGNLGTLLQYNLPEDVQECSNPSTS